MINSRILIVEDDTDTREQLAALFREVLSNAHITTAADVTDAHSHLQLALEKRRPFDIAILDFKLPRSLGEYSEIDESICCRIRDTMPGTLVAHVTGFLDDAVVREHIRAVHSPADPLGFVLDKSNADFATELVRQTQRYLYGAYIAKHLSELFDTGGADRTSRLAPAGSRGSSADISARLLTVTGAIALSWGLLGSDIRHRVLNHFEVQEMGKSVQVVLR
jgi:CheY-like chemotaxis protein